MADNKEWEVQDVIEEDDEHFISLFEDVGMATLMEEDVDSESGSQNGLRGVDDHVKGPSREKEETMVTRERTATQGKRIVADARATNKPFVQQLTTGLTYYGREL